MRREKHRSLVMVWGATFCLAAFCVSFIGIDARGQDAPKEAGDDTAQIKAAIQAYVAAFNARDAQKLAILWSPDGVYISRTSGERVTGRAELAKEFTSLFAGENVPQLAVATESIEFVSPNVAIERGQATVKRAAEDIVETDYSVVYVKRDGDWLVDRVTEDEIPVTSASYAQLKKLDWLMGEWTFAEDDFKIEIACRWTKNQNFISRTFSVSNENGVESSGLQMIGWDPSTKQIRSWLFDSDGGFVKGVWTQRVDRWVVQSVATLGDGGKGSFTSIFRPQNDGTYAWRKINQVVDGKLLPNLTEAVVRRK